jgi:sugar phosphate isomerase/epimerase
LEHFKFPFLPVWNVIRQVGGPNLGVVVDAFHIFVRGRTAEDLKGIPFDKISLVQLSDLEHGVDCEHVIATARHHRLRPGRGHFPIETILDPLKEAGYAGPIGLIPCRLMALAGIAATLTGIVALRTVIIEDNVRAARTRCAIREFL